MPDDVGNDASWFYRSKDQAHSLMKLVGRHQINAVPGDHSLYVDVFARLPKELRCAGDRLRYIGYEAVSRQGTCVRFIGAEAAPADAIPTGMEAWDLTEESWTIRREECSPRVAHQEAIQWLWRDDSTIGEFLAHGPDDWRRDGVPAEVSMISHAWFATDGEGPDDQVVLADYDPSWPDRFTALSEWLHRVLGPDMARRIEHYGSTAIPGMPAKPVIDMLVEIPSFPEAKRRVVPLLNSPEWEYWWYSDHMVLIKRREFLGKRECHVHLAPAGHEVWKGLAFRDRLRAHPEDAKRYAELKRKLASAHQRDREAYTEAKRALVNEITAKAKQD